MPYKDPLRQKEAQRQHYLANKQNYICSRRKNRDERDVWLEEYKRDKKCVRCGEPDSRCFDFHHPDASKKLFQITEAVKQGYALGRIKAEIAKCEILCANCHRLEHYQERTPEDYARSWVGENVLWLRQQKSMRVCMKCQTEDWRLLDFHHRDGVEKKQTLSKMAGSGCSIQALLEEIAKCDVYCANCHRKHHNNNKWKEASVRKGSMV